MLGVGHQRRAAPLSLNTRAPGDAPTILARTTTLAPSHYRKIFDGPHLRFASSSLCDRAPRWSKAFSKAANKEERRNPTMSVAKLPSATSKGSRNHKAAITGKIMAQLSSCFIDSSFRQAASDHMWIWRFSTANAASLTASDMVGWAWQVRAISSDDPPNSIRTAAS